MLRKVHFHVHVLIFPIADIIFIGFSVALLKGNQIHGVNYKSVHCRVILVGLVIDQFYEWKYENWSSSIVWCILIIDCLVLLYK